MKRFAWIVAAVFALGMGVGTSLSAYGNDDPGCLASCQEQLNDCRAQSQDPQWNSRHCNPIYRACVAACSA